MNVLADFCQYINAKLPNVEAFAGWVNAATKYPCITFWLVDEQEQRANEAPWLATPIIQIDCWSKKGVAESDDLAARVKTAIAGYGEPMAQHGRRHFSETTSKGTVIYRTMLQYEIKNYLGVVEGSN